MKEKIDALVLALRAGSRALAFASVCSSIFLKDRKKINNSGVQTMRCLSLPPFLKITFLKSRREKNTH